MSALVDLIVQSTDPVTALLLVVLVYYVRQIKEDLRREIRQVRLRVKRLEDGWIPEEPTSYSELLHQQGERPHEYDDERYRDDKSPRNDDNN